jgi:hypothetical protein
MKKLMQLTPIDRPPSIVPPYSVLEDVGSRQIIRRSGKPKAGSREQQGKAIGNDPTSVDSAVDEAVCHRDGRHHLDALIHQSDSRAPEGFGAVKIACLERPIPDALDGPCAACLHTRAVIDIYMPFADASEPRERGEYRVHPCPDSQH